MRRAVAAVLLASLLACPAASAQRTELVVIAKLKSRHQESRRAFSFRQDLFRAKVKVGTARVRCERRSKRFTSCAGTYELTDGAIEVADDVRRGARNPTLDVVGGTGAFDGVAGTMHVENLNHHTSRNTFRLTADPPRGAGRIGGA